MKLPAGLWQGALLAGVGMGVKAATDNHRFNLVAYLAAVMIGGLIGVMLARRSKP